MKRLPKENCQDFIRYINFLFYRFGCFTCRYNYASVCQKSMWDSPEWELQMDAHHHVGVRNYTQVFCKSNRSAEPSLQPSVLNLCFFLLKKNPFLNCKFFIIKFIKIIKNLLIFEYFESSSFTSFLFLNKYVPNNQLSICYFVILYRVWRNVCSNPINPSFDIVLEDQVIFHFFKKL